MERAHSLSVEEEERIFWQEVHDAYAQEEPEAIRIERELWDTTVGDGSEEETAC